MALDLNQARNIVRRSALHIDNSSFDDEKVDDAIKLAGKAFLRLTKASLTTTSVTLSQGVTEFNPTSSITGFTQSDYELGEINGHQVRLLPYQSILRNQLNVRTGRPSQVAFRPDDKGLLDKKTDQEYTLNITHRKRFTEFASGTGSNPSLNLPDEYGGSVMWFGGRYYLLYGAPGHPDAEAARDEFASLIQEAQAQFGRIVSGTKDLSVPLTQWGAATRGGE